MPKKKNNSLIFGTNFVTISFITYKIIKMTDSEIKINHDNIVDALNNRNISYSINKLKEFIMNSNINSIYIDEIDKVEATYKYMINYLVEGVDDPKRDEVYSKLLLNLYSINDEILHLSLQDISPKLYYGTKRYLKNRNYNLNQLMYRYHDALKKQELSEYAKDESLQLEIELEGLEDEMFNYIWTITEHNIVEIELIRTIIDDNIPSYFKSLIVKALVLSAITSFHETKINLLFDLYNHKESVVNINAIIGLIIISYKYNNRIKLSSNLMSRFNLIEDNSNFREDYKCILFQIIKSNDTARISKKMQDELIPQLMKISPKMYRKFKGQDLKSLEDEMSENPEWQNILEDTGITKKIQEFNEMQLDGGDVFMSTFSHLKNFPFFNRLSNWFLPFHSNHSTVTSRSEDSKIYKIIETAKFLCNNDKYSFALAISSVPQAQKQIMESQFNSQNIDLKEMKSSEITTNRQERDGEISIYIQDLYRFHNLFNHRSQFYNPFAIKIVTDRSVLDKFYLDNIEILKVFSEFYFKRGYYNEAISMFNIIISHKEDISASYYQKIGFCYQQLGGYSKAVSFLEKADFIDSNSVWTLKHLAFCNKMLSNLDTSLDLYKRAERIQPDNLSLLLNIGHVLLENNDYKEALTYYYKVDYMTSGSVKTWRPIGWCEFLLDNYSQSFNYYNKIPNDVISAQDYLNIGHLFLVQKDYKHCIEYYNKAFVKLNRNVKQFDEEIQSDYSYLKGKGINELTISIIKDKVKYYE